MAHGISPVGLIHQEYSGCSGYYLAVCTHHTKSESQAARFRSNRKPDPSGLWKNHNIGANWADWGADGTLDGRFCIFRIELAVEMASRPPPMGTDEDL